MEPSEQRAIMTISLFAAFADGMQDDRERDALKRSAESLSVDGGVQLASLYQDVLLGRVDLAHTANQLKEPAHRQLAYELAVCVCEADGELNDAERNFLRDLKKRLALEAATVSSIEQDAETLAAAPLTASAAVMSPAMAASSSLGSSIPSVSERDLDRYILNHAIVNGALELLPQSLATMAIIPLQMKLVYSISKAYGFELDKGHIREFITTAGVGLSSQYVEQIGRKLLGGVLGGVAGSLGRGVGRAATGVAFSFATTYALGRLAQRYYAAGRQMNPELLRRTYESLLGEAKRVQGEYMGEIQQKARSLNLRELMSSALHP